MMFCEHILENIITTVTLFIFDNWMDDLDGEKCLARSGINCKICCNFWIFYVAVYDIDYGEIR